MNRILLTLAIVVTFVTLAACREITVRWVPESNWQDAEAARQCRVDVLTQPSGSVHFELIDCRPETTAILDIAGSGTHRMVVGRVRIWTPNPRSPSNFYDIRTNVRDGNINARIGDPVTRVGRLHYTW